MLHLRPQIWRESQIFQPEVKEAEVVLVQPSSGGPLPPGRQEICWYSRSFLLKPVEAYPELLDPVASMLRDNSLLPKWPYKLSEYHNVLQNIKKVPELTKIKKMLQN